MKQTLPVLFALTCMFLFGITTKTALAATTTVMTQAETEKHVRNFFKYTPVMAEIARCESEFRQFTDAGNPLRSAGMIGVFQFYESIHAPAAKNLGFDLATLEGNMGYAKHVYEAEGTTPWNGSRYCWETAAAKTTLSSTDREKLLEQIATLTKLIALLQKQLEIKQLALR